MIYFLHGTDTEKARVKAHDLIDSLLKKKPDASFFKVDAEHFDMATLEGYIGGQGLFENKYIVFLDRICSEKGLDKKVKDDFLDKIKEIAESKNIFIILEGKLDKASLTKFEKNAEKVQEFILAEKTAKPEANPFALANAFGMRNKKEAWVLYRKAIDHGEAPEALHGMLFWKVKSMILSSTFGTFSREELQNLMTKLVDVYHESRRGMHELETGLEVLILEM